MEPQIKHELLTVWAILPLLTWLGATVACFTGSVRVAMLRGALVLGLLLVGSTELLSAGEWISPLSVTLVWTLLGLPATCWSLRKLPEFVRALTRAWAGLSRGDRGLVIGIACILGCVFITAWNSIPNTPDVIAYHMTRVGYWAQHHTVAHYPTNDWQCLHSNPLAEYGILHLRMLTGGDRGANLVQWLALVGCVVGVSVLTADLGGLRRAQLVASVFCVTIPMAIMQGSNAKNDLVLSFWLVMLAIAVLRSMRADAMTWECVIWAGVSLGCGVLTKATAYPYCLPFVVVLCLIACLRARWRELGKLAAVGAIALLINAGHYSRDAATFGSPTGPVVECGGSKYTNDVYGFRPMFSNMLRSVALHLVGPFPGINDNLYGVVNLPHKLIGWDVNDPRTTWDGKRFELLPTRLYEDNDGNLLHFLLISLAAITIALRGGFRRDRKLLTLAACAFAGFCLFCLILRWQTWHSRLHTPLFVLSSPMVVAAFVQDRPRLEYAAAALLLLAAAPWALANQTRPLIGNRSILARGRFDSFFDTVDPSRDSLEVARLIAREGHRDIAVCSSGRATEYPLHVALNAVGVEASTVRFGHVHLEQENPSSRCASPKSMTGFRPTLLIFFGNGEGMGDRTRLLGQEVAEFGQYRLFKTER